MTNATLGEVADVTAGQPAPQGEGVFGPSGRPFIRAGSLEALVAGANEMDCELLPDDVAHRHRLRLFQKDTIVFAKSGMSAKLGRIYRLREPAYVVSHLAAITPKQGVDAGYLQRWFEVHPPSRLIPNDAYPSIRTSAIAGLKIDLPGLDEQKRIAAILDKADAVRRKREQAIQLADDFLRSVFLEMFGDLQTDERGWDTGELGEYIQDGPQNGLYRPASDYIEDGTPILRIDGFYDGYIANPETMKRVRIPNSEIEKYSLSDGDIVINRVNSKKFLGKAALVDGIKEPTVYESNMMRFRVETSKLYPRFLVDQLRDPSVRSQIAVASKDAVNQSSINQNDVKSLIVRIPPLQLQAHYSAIVRSTNQLKIKLRALSSLANQSAASCIAACFGKV